MQFWYYDYRLNFPEADTLLSQIHDVGIKKLEDDDLDQYAQELSTLKAGPLQGKSRVWLLLARKKPHVEEDIMERLNQVAVPVERKQFPDVMVGLYDFS